MLLPFRFSIAGAELFPVRVLVLVLFVPMLIKLLSGAAGRIRGVDIAMAAYGLWACLGLIVNDGLARAPLGIITFVDLFGGWLVGRTLIRSAADFRIFVRAMIWACVVMFPVALLEFLTNFNLLQEIFRPIFDTFRKGWTSYGRLGFERVMAGFAHPILYGVFCSIAVATSYYVYRHLKTKAVLLAGFLVFMTFMSLSAGPFLAAILQVGLITWGRITRNAWKPLAWMVVVSYVVVDLLSNRTPITIAINYVTFNAATAWYRVAQWKYGIQEVWANPLFGIGLGDWSRPHWLGSSVDNFWLLTTMRGGIPVFLLLVGGLALLIFRLVRLRNLSNEADAIRTGYLITVCGVALSLATVHVWGALGIFIMMFFGSGAWLLDAEGTTADDRDETRTDPDAGTPALKVRPGLAANAAPSKRRPTAAPAGPRKPLPLNGRLDRRKR